MQKKRFFALAMAAALVLQAVNFTNVSAAGIIPDQSLKQIILKDANVDAKKVIAYTMDKTDYGDGTYAISFYVRTGDKTFSHYSCSIDATTGMIEKRDSIDYEIISPDEAKQRAIENEGLLDVNFKSVNIRFGEYNGNLVYKVFLHTFGNNVDRKLYDQKFSSIFPMDQKEYNTYGNCGLIYIVNAISGSKYMGTLLGLFNCSICIPQIVADDDDDDD